jgi:FtsZ-binding cell division protein ZapB
MKEAGDIAQARERQHEAEAELKEIEAELEREVQELQSAGPDAAIETTEIKPKKSGVDVRLVALVWKPSGS